MLQWIEISTDVGASTYRLGQDQLATAKRRSTGKRPFNLIQNREEGNIRSSID